ncbi:hypothetical protein QLX08_003655 [Tetragonisca angustula]|uniref:Uncharacterized protein n=1 Tax=Tetragonisca angustula TaxID=166442 RepID=A0AAW1A5T4_9HYME
MKDDENMTSSMSRSKIEANYLREVAGAEAKDENLAYDLLDGPPESYGSLNMILANLPDDKFNLAEIIRVLLAEYDCRCSRQEVHTGKHKEALYATRRLNQQHPNKEMDREKLKQIVCYKCNKVGYFASANATLHIIQRPIKEMDI